VFTAFANGASWQSLLEGIFNVQYLYNDGYHKEFLMTISRPVGTEIIRGFCFCSPNSRIEIFYAEPLSGFQKITDIWHFEELNEETRVTVERRFQLTDITSSTTEIKSITNAYEESKLKLSSYLSENLNLLKKKLEAESSKVLL
jgi:hypothetical protein